MIKNLRKNKKGFTLVEIIVVVVILAVLMAVAVPSVLKYLNEADNAKYMAQARAIMTSAQTEIIKDYAPDKTMSVGENNATLIANVNAAVGGDGITVTALTVYSDAACTTAINWASDSPSAIKGYKATWTFNTKEVNATIIPNGSITIEE